MTINYCDYTLGNDTTGDGSAGNPYKTINKASTGLGGGDEVRCAKSSAPTSLTGTLSWVNGSTSISTSDDLTGVLAAMDFIGKNTAGETWWEISSLDASSITLVKAYVGTTEGVASYKLGVIDTGDAINTATTVQTILAGGDSDSSLLAISGGWNLTTETPDGETWFWQSGAGIYGRALYATTRRWIEIDNIGFLRYFRGIYLYNVYDTSTLDSVVCIGCQCSFYIDRCSYLSTINCESFAATIGGIYFEFCVNGSWDSFVSKYSSGYGVYLNGSDNISFDNGTFNNNTTDGIRLDESNAIYVKDTTCNNNQDSGIYVYDVCYGANLADITCNNNTEYGIRNLNSDITTVNTFLASGNVLGDIYSSNDANYQGVIAAPTLRLQHYNTVGNNISYFSDKGYIQRNTSEAISGSCVQFVPLSADDYISTNFYTAVYSGRSMVVSLYMKKDGSFNGDVVLEVWFLGEIITGPTTLSLTTDYVKQDMSVSDLDITEDGVLEFRAKVRGTAGNVYADNFSWVYA